MMRKPLELQERSRILKLRAKGMSIVAISKELHRSKRTISAFIKDPVNFLKSMKSGSATNNSSNVPYNKLSGESPKKRESNSISPAASDNKEKSTNTNSPVKEKSPKRVGLEHRSVIKFLTKKGWNAVAIHDDMKHVYKSSAPSLNAIEFWVNECKTNPSINFDKIARAKAAKNKTATGKADKIWVVRSTIKKAKANIKKAATAKKKENNSSNNKEKDKNDKIPTSKNLITLKLFENNAVKNRSSV